MFNRLNEINQSSSGTPFKKLFAQWHKSRSTGTFAQVSPNTFSGPQSVWGLETSD